MKIGNKPKAQDMLLALAVLMSEVAGTALCAMTVLYRKSLLSAWTEMAYMFLGGILALIFLTVSFCVRNPAEGKIPDKIKRRWMDVLSAELWLLAIYYLWRFLQNMLNAFGGRFLTSEIACNVAEGLLAFAAVLAASLLLPRLFQACGMDPGKDFASRLAGFVGVFFSCGLLIVVPLLWSWLSEMRGLSVVNMLAGHVITAFCEYAMIKLLIWVLCRERKSAAGNAQESMAASEEPETPAENPSAADIPVADAFATDSPVKNPPAADVSATGCPAENPSATDIPAADAPVADAPVVGRKALGVGIPLAVTAILIFLTGGGLPAASVVEQTASLIEAPVNEGYSGLETGNLEKAIQCFARAEARARAFRSLVSEEAEESLKSVYGEYPDDIVIGALYLSDRNDVRDLEKNIRNYTYGSAWYPVLLRFYEEQTKLYKEQEQPSEDEALSEEQKSLQSELLLRCIAMEQYTENGCVFAQDLEGSKLAVLKQLQNYEEEFAVYGVFRLMTKYGSEGGYSEDLVYEALEIAEDQPDNMLLQYAAYQIGSSFREDKARHYGRTMEAASRFDEIYDDGTKTDSQLADEKRSLGDAAVRCYQYEAALAYYETSYELSGEASVALSCAKVWEKLGNYEECARMAAGVLMQEPENTQALYLMAISSLKTGDVDGALKAAGELGDLVADRDRPVDAAEENNLYVCAQYLAMSDNSLWTDYTWQVYGSLSEEQIAEVQTHELLWDYMTAIYQCFMRKGYEEASQAVENILALRDDLPMAWYLRGTISFNEKDFENALEAFENASNCGGEAPAIYFSIANVYDAMRDYENAWAYAKRVEEMLPYQDHGSDVYGISYHNTRLLNALKIELGR